MSYESEKAFRDSVDRGKDGCKSSQSFVSSYVDCYRGIITPDLVREEQEAREQGYRVGIQINEANKASEKATQEIKDHISQQMSAGSTSSGSSSSPSSSGYYDDYDSGSSYPVNTTATASSSSSNVGGIVLTTIVLAIAIFLFVFVIPYESLGNRTLFRYVEAGIAYSNQVEVLANDAKLIGSNTRTILDERTEAFKAELAILDECVKNREFTTNDQDRLAQIWEWQNSAHKRFEEERQKYYDALSKLLDFVRKGF